MSEDIIKFEELERRSLWHYPTLYGGDTDRARMKWLNHAFLIIGNGFDWEEHDGVSYLVGDAEPTDHYTQSKYTPPTDVNRGGFKYKTFTSKEEMAQARAEDIAKEEKYVKSCARHEGSCHDWARSVVHVHSISGARYEKLFNIPENAEQEALEAAQDVCMFIVDNEGVDGIVKVENPDDLNLIKQALAEITAMIQEREKRDV